MKLKRTLIAAVLFVASVAPTVAQETSAATAGQETNAATAQETNRNQVYTALLNNVQYEVPRVEKKKTDVGTTLGQLANAFLNNRSVEINSETPFDDATGIVTAIINGLTRSYRIRVTDGTNMVVNSPEEKYDYTMQVVVAKAVTTTKTGTKDVSEKDKDGKVVTKKVNITLYDTYLDVTLCQTDAKTNQIDDSPKFVIRREATTSSQAVSEALAELTTRVRRYYRHAYPLTANIIEGARAKKDKQKEIYIDLGEKGGAREDMHMAVYVEKQVAGKTARRQLGKVKILEVQGDDVSLCKVQNGSKDIKSALDEGVTLVVMTTD